MWKHAELPGLGISSAFWKSLEVQLVKKKIQVCIWVKKWKLEWLASFEDFSKDLGNQKQGAFTSSFDKLYEMVIS